MGVRMLLEFVFTQAELKILDDPLPFARTKERLDKEEEAATRDISTDVRLKTFSKIRFFQFKSYSFEAFLIAVPKAGMTH